jgi:hypothetical protein
MSLLPRVTYLSKNSNQPFYSSEKELHIVEYDRGWVEYLLQESDIYFVRLDQALLDFYHCQAIDWIETAWRDQNPRYFSLLNKLCHHRMEKPFDLPLFADWKQGPVLSCGNTRFTAEIVCGASPNSVPVFVQVPKGTPTPAALSQATAITSTAQAETLAGMEQVEYKLNFSQTDQPVVITSILRNTVFEADSGYSTFEDDGNFILEFWKKFTRNGRINITVSCNPETQRHVDFNPDIWNVKFNFMPMLGFSFGEILAKFGKPDNDELNLYIYDIEKSFNLCYLLPWANINSVWYHTQNKKINLFETTRGGATACWPIVMMGNFVK